MFTPPIEPFLFHLCDLERAQNDSSGSPNTLYPTKEFQVRCMFQDHVIWRTPENSKQITALFFFGADTLILPLQSRIIFSARTYFVERCDVIYADSNDSYHHLEVYCV